MSIRAPRATRIASSAALALMAVGALASCSVEPAAGGTDAGSSATGSSAAASTDAASSAPAASSSTPDAPASAGATGTWTETGDYQTPGGRESVTVTLTAKDGSVTAVSVKGSGGTPNSQQYQGAFISGVSGEVVGKPLATLEVGAVSGSSLTGNGFNAAVEKIRADAA